nr:MAG TPA_asm: HNH endonuclease bacteriophage, HNH Endonuclease, DNA.52A [Caudoviricetes sp.]
MNFDYSRKNRRWRRLRERVLHRDGYMCQEARRYGKYEPAEVVHHIWPAEDYPEYAYCAWNLISLSVANHDKLHDRTTRKLTPDGERWRKRTPPPSAPEK